MKRKLNVFNKIYKNHYFKKNDISLGEVNITYEKRFFR